ncbi:hypothetical protein FQZ97_1129380 [compost metagenome]
MNRIDTHQGLTTGDLTAGLVDDRKKQRIFARRYFFEPRLKSFTRCRWNFEQPCETLIGIRYGRGRKQLVTMLFRIKRLKPDIAAFQNLAFRPRAGGPVLQISHFNAPIL